MIKIIKSMINLIKFVIISYNIENNSINRKCNIKQTLRKMDISNKFEIRSDNY